MSLSFEKSELNLSIRIRIAFAIIAVTILIFLVRLWYLQIINGQYFRERSENNRLRTIYLPAPRGIIFDRNGEVIVKNRPSFDIELITEDAPDPRESVERLADYLDLSAEELLKDIGDQKKRRRFEPRLLLKDVSREIVAKVILHRYELPGIVVTVVPTRDYVYGDLAAHVLGYIREITKEQLDSPRYAGYKMNDRVGQFGLELRLEEYLQGKRGIQNVIVNALGRRTGEFSFEPEVQGHHLTVTLDLDVQKAAEAALGKYAGAVVAMDPRNGEILAMVSHPAFNPNVFAGEVSANEWKRLTSGSEKPMSNRSVQGAYPPGSTWKIFMLAAALAEGVIGTSDSVRCPGYLAFAGRRYHCHKREGHGSVNLLRALTVSCDIYFYTIGQRLGIDRIFEYASKFGFSKKTGLELVEEATGIVPSTAWKKSYFRSKGPGEQKWYPGETLSVAIGQGATTATPLQLTSAVAALVNGGKHFKPILIKGVGSKEGAYQDYTSFKSEVTSTLGLDKKIEGKIREAMVSVVNSPEGTGKRSQVPKEYNVIVGGKTGTAQVVSLDYHKKGGSFDHHAWFVGYAPDEDPEIVVTALVEHGGGGGAVAAPIVGEVMKAYFAKTRPEIAAEIAKKEAEKEKP